jgi:predicted nucleic acid-binding protein
VNPPVARRAAQLRAEYSLRPADALHVATSLVAGATAWITNDRGLRRLSSLIAVIVLDDILATL